MNASKARALSMQSEAGDFMKEETESIFESIRQAAKQGLFAIKTEQMFIL